jgi:hypothetical protein
VPEAVFQTNSIGDRQYHQTGMNFFVAHSITLSVRASKVGGISRPIADPDWHLPRHWL